MIDIKLYKLFIYYIIMTLRTGEEYIEAIKNRSKVEIFVMGKEVKDVTKDPFLKPSILSYKATYDAAHEEDSKALARAWSQFINDEVNRFTHIHRSPEDLAAKVKLLRKISHKTGACFQRCVGWDALNTLYIVTRLMAEKDKKDYYERFVEYLKYVQKNDIALAGAMTDVKGVRTLRPSEQPNAYLRVTEVTSDGIYVSGAKANITGIAASEEIVVMPTRAMGEKDQDFAVSFSIPLDTEGIKVIIGRQINDARRFEEGNIDGLPYRVNHEGLIIFDNVFVPMNRVFMLRDWQMSGILVEIFSAYHRQGYGGCKSGLADVIIGASYNLAKQVGVDKASHVQNKLTEMVLLTENMYSTGIAASLDAIKLCEDGCWWVNPMFANVTKQLVTKFPYEITKLSTDLAGGILGTAPSEFDLKNPKLRPYIEKYLQGIADYSVEDRLRMIRLLENIGFSVAFLIESVHGAGSPEAQRIVLNRIYDYEYAEKVAKYLAEINKKVEFKDEAEPWRETDTQKVAKH